MRTIEGFKLRRLGDEYILVGESVNLVNFNKMITMNDSAAYLWEQVDGAGDFDAARLTELLLAEYEVEEAQAAKDAEATLKAWLEAGIIA